MANDDDDLPDTGRDLGEESAAPDEPLTEHVARAWREESDEGLTCGDIVRRSGKAG
jgi:hypothetical protein